MYRSSHFSSFANKFRPMTSNSKETVVLFPYSSGMGHLIPMVELAKLFITHNFSVTILIVDPPYSSPINSSFLSRVSSAHPFISFHRLPKVLTVPDLSPSPPLANHQVIRHSNPLISTFLTSLSQTSSVRALVLDMFCTSALDVAREHDLPAYFFFASGASVLSAFIMLPGMQSQTAASFKDLGETPLHFPGVPSIPASYMPVSVQDRESETYKTRMYDFERLPKADGILVNTFESLERRAVEALKDGSCYPADCPMPPVYCIGPVVAGHENGGAGSERHVCLTWLDAQPKGSVVFLCFGSMGTFSVEQLKEIAIGLEKSGQRFLWVVRYPITEDPSAKPLKALLPEGFLERTEGQGMVVESWAPQAEVLGHESVGGFVSHCGWNSTLEAVSEGVPIIAWPLYAEQRMNKVFLVETAKLAVEMKGYDKELVSAEEVEMKVRWLIESEGGRELKNHAAEVKESAATARMNGGSSNKAWMELVNALKEQCGLGVPKSN